jgi:hypothetical protein
LADAPLVAAWLRGVLAKDVAVEPGKTLGDICAYHGWLRFQDELRELFENTSNETVERHARLLADWTLRKDRNADRKTLCRQFAGLLLSAVERWSPTGAGRDWQSRTVNRAELLPPLLQSFLSLHDDELVERLATYVLSQPKVFDLTTVQAPALLSLETWLKRSVKRPCPPLRRWLTALAAELQSRASHPPKEPTDWRRPSDTGCTCVDCQALSGFLKNPNAETIRLPMAKDRRQHLHGVIDSRQLDTTHVTERRGSPHVLVCTKTKASYQRSLKAHEVDLDHRAKIGKLLERCESLGKGKG